MKANERVKYLRKNILKLTQQDFSEALKISRSNIKSMLDVALNSCRD